ncbi:MAG: response regulator [Aestuariibacter sp.]
MNLDPSGFIRRAPKSISAVFILLAVSLQLSLAIYWSQVLQPKLRSEAEADSKIIAESQSAHLLNALLDVQEMDELTILEDALDKLMLYQEPTSGRAFFNAIELELDSDTFGDIDNIQRGESRCESCFSVDVALYSPDNFALLGIAHFKVSDSFFQVLAKDIRNQLFIQGGITLLLLLLAWFTAVLLIRSLQKETLRREASEIALSENQKKYHRLISNLSQYFVYTRDKDGKITYIADSVNELYGYRPRQMLKLHELLTPNPINNIARRYLKTPTKNVPQLEFEIEILDKHGDNRWILLSEINLFDDDNDFVGVEGLGRDITKQKQIEADLLEAKEQAEIANKAKGLFLANMSHEIRTPMNAIVGNIYLMQKTSLDIRQTQFAKRIESSSQVLLQLVNDILDISKIEAGKMELEDTEFTLSDVFDNLSNVVVSQAQKKKLDILYDIAPEVPQHLKGDPYRLNQILLNLVNNAIKFTEKGEIVVQVQMQSRLDDKACLLFSVQDEGIGISESKQSQLFHSFNQVDNSVTRRFGGTGLGLSICQHLVNLMGGKIGVESEFGKGSTFFFSIDMDIDADAVAQSSLQQHELAALIIDDSLNTTRVLQLMLQQIGATVTVAHSPEHGLELLSANDNTLNYDVIFINYNMPNLSGIETAEQLQQLPDKPDAKLILITACDLEELDKNNVDRLFSDILFKPFTQSSLQDTLATSGIINYQPASTEIPAQPESLRGNKVLLVEDNHINQEVAVALLEDISVEVILAENGQRALDKLAQESFDLILMDVQMPVMDGLTATRKIKKELNIDTPIIAMTANAMDEDREKATQAGMQDFITKPIDVVTFYKTLGKWLGNDDSVTAHQDITPDDLPNIPEINVSEAIKRVGNKTTLLLSLLKEFVRSYGDFSEQLKHAVRVQDTEQQLALLHKLKGESGNISATKVHQATSHLESQIKQGQLLNELQLLEFELLLNTTLETISAGLPAVSIDPAVVVENSAQQLSQAHLEHLVEQLILQLQRQELGAVESGEKLLAQLPEQVNSRLKDDFLNHLQQLDFSEAETLLGEIKQQLSNKQ